jgi:hypothetical protein
VYPLPFVLLTKEHHLSGGNQSRNYNVLSISRIILL